MSDEFAIILCTTPAGESEKIARALVKKRLVACVNISRVNSYFRWEGKLCDEKEDLLIIKTKRVKIGEIIERIKELHPYELPEVIAIPIIEGYDKYLAWMDEEIK